MCLFTTISISLFQQLVLSRMRYLKCFDQNDRSGLVPAESPRHLGWASCSMVGYCSVPVPVLYSYRCCYRHWLKQLGSSYSESVLQVLKRYRHFSCWHSTSRYPYFIADLETALFVRSTALVSLRSRLSHPLWCPHFHRKDCARIATHPRYGCPYLAVSYYQSFTRGLTFLNTTKISRFPIEGSIYDRRRNRRMRSVQIRCQF